MAAIALVARPRLFGVGMLVGMMVALVLVPDAQPPEAHIEFGSWRQPGQSAVVTPDLRLWGNSIAASKDAIAPDTMADARGWPRGMVMSGGSVRADRMDTGVVAQWLSGFLSWLASRPA